MAAHSDDVFRALADPSRRHLLDLLRERSGQTLRELCGELDMARQSVSKHLAVLEDAGLVVTERRGREKLHRLNAAPINEIADRWISQYDRPRARALADLKTALEARPMFVYDTHIKATPEQVWAALTQPEFTKRYWGMEFVTDWQAGSPVVWIYKGVRMEDSEQVVLEADRPRRLSYTWHAITPEFAEFIEIDEATRDHLASFSRTKVTFDIEPRGDTVRLRVTHDGFDDGDPILEGISEGWPRIVSDLKTLLETGETLPAEPKAA